MNILAQVIAYLLTHIVGTERFLFIVALISGAFGIDTNFIGFTSYEGFAAILQATAVESIRIGFDTDLFTVIIFTGDFIVVTFGLALTF